MGRNGREENILTAENVVAVVLNWKDAENTLACVDSLLLDKHINSIIVVDNESDGLLRGPLEVRGRSLIKLIERPENLGFSAGVNVGLHYASQLRADFILVINNDAVILPGCLEVLLRTIGAGVGICAPTILNEDGSVQTEGDHMNRVTGGVGAARGDSPTNFLTWACVLIPIDTIRKVGYLDELFFMYWEDVDYAFRCREAGLRLITTSEAQVVHKLGASNSSAGWRIQLFWMLGLAHLTKKWGGTFWLGLGWRLARRTAKLIVACDLRGLCASWRGLSLGIASKEPAAKVLKEIGVIS